MGMSPAGKAVEVRADYHFTTTERLEEMKQISVDSGSPADFGEFLHAFQDSFSHAGYGPTVGHLFAGHAPDKTYNDVEKADKMARATFVELLNSEFSNIDNAVDWEAVSDAVHNFNLAETEEQKFEAFRELRITILDEQESTDDDQE